MPADRIFYNAKIYSVDKDYSVYNWIAVSNGKISALGNNSDYKTHIGNNTQLINLNGKTIIPGLIDAHTHLIHFGLMNLDSVELLGAKSIEEIKTKLRNFSDRCTFQCIIRGHGFDQELLEDKRWPTKQDLDEISTEHPIIISRVCLHALVANSPALSLVKDTLTEKEYKTGILTELSAKRLKKSLPAPSEEKLKESAVWAFNYSRKAGLTGAHCMIHSHRELKILTELDAEKKIPIRLTLILARELVPILLENCNLKNYSSDYLKIGPIKLFMDGSMGAATAAMKDPYSDNPFLSGNLLISYEEVINDVEYLQNNGFQVAFHAIGDLAIETAVNAIEFLCQKDKNTYKFRHRIEHASQMTHDLILKMAKIGVLAVVQPQFITSDFWTRQRVGKKRYDCLYAYKSMLDAGVRLSFGSDCPVEKLEPMTVIHSAVNREKYSIDECLSVQESIKAFTYESAYAGHNEKLQGSLEVGKFADFVVLDDNPHTMEKDKIKDIKVIATYVNGK
ncbi:MAG: amidohydrolase [Armatimonadota bacterium]